MSQRRKHAHRWKPARDPEGAFLFSLGPTTDGVSAPIRALQRCACGLERIQPPPWGRLLMVGGGKTMDMPSTTFTVSASHLVCP